jgi:hypothetical protein
VPDDCRSEITNVSQLLGELAKSMTIPQETTTISLADTLKSNLVMQTLIINGGKLNQELFENLVKRMNSVQRKTALMIIKRYNIGVKKADQ